MKFNTRIIYLLLLTAMAIIATAMFPVWPQDPSFHRFADNRTMLGIPNFLNVVSNLPFLFVGSFGLGMLNKFRVPVSLKFILVILFAGILMTGVGSAYYHYAPDNDTLVWDRIPMTIVFMSFLCATISRLINLRAGALIVVPLVLIGVSSVLWWHYLEIQGNGDLRFYGFIQYYPMLFIPLIMILFPNAISKKELRFLAWVIAWYVMAKIFERLDKQIFDAVRFISGHSIKHLAAAVATWYIVKIFSRDDN